MQFDDWILLPQRLAIHPETATAVVSDLHLGYRETRNRKGDAIPSMPLDLLLAPLIEAMVQAKVCRLVVAGDLFEAAPSPDLLNQWHEWIAKNQIELVALIPGNHDRGLAIEGSIPLAWEGVRLGKWHVVHGDQKKKPQGAYVQGHEHPALRFNNLNAPCFLASSEHLSLPAYSLDAAGVNILEKSSWLRHSCAVIAGDQVLDFGVVGKLGPRIRLMQSNSAISRPSWR